MITLISNKEVDITDEDKDALILAILIKSNTIVENIEVLDLKTHSKELISSIINSSLPGIIGACRPDGNIIGLDINNLNAIIDNENVSDINIYKLPDDVIDTINMYIRAKRHKSN